MFGDRVVLSSTDDGQEWGMRQVTLSQREYGKYRIPGIRLEPRGAYHEQDLLLNDSGVDQRPVDIYLFVDTITGVYVHNVEAYERSLGLEPETRTEYY